MSWSGSCQVHFMIAMVRAAQGAQPGLRGRQRPDWRMTASSDPWVAGGALAEALEALLTGLSQARVRLQRLDAWGITLGQAGQEA